MRMMAFNHKWKDYNDNEQGVKNGTFLAFFCYRQQLHFYPACRAVIWSDEDNVFIIGQGWREKLFLVFNFNDLLSWKVFWWFHPIMQLLGIPGQNICKYIATIFTTLQSGYDPYKRYIHIPDTVQFPILFWLSTSCAVYKNTRQQREGSAFQTYWLLHHNAQRRQANIPKGLDS